MRFIIFIFILSSFFSLQAKEIEVLPEAKCEYELIISNEKKATLKESSKLQNKVALYSFTTYIEETNSGILINDSVPIYLRQCKFLN